MPDRLPDKALESDRCGSYLFMVAVLFVLSRIPAVRKLVIRLPGG
jgi:hypothetical protein